MAELRRRALAAATILASAAGCSLVFSPGGFTNGDVDAGGDAGPGRESDAGNLGDLPTCNGNPGVVCRDFCKALAPPGSFCADFDDGGLAGSGLHLSVLGNGTRVDVDSLDMVSAPASLVADWPASATKGSSAFVSRTFDVGSARQIDLSLDFLVESASDAGTEGTLVELLFAPGSDVSGHYVGIKVDSDSAGLYQHYVNDASCCDQRSGFPVSLRTGEWRHLELEVKLPPGGTGGVSAKIDGQSAVEQPVEGPWTPMELVLGMDAAPIGRHSRLRYDNVVLYIH